MKRSRSRSPRAKGTGVNKYTGKKLSKKYFDILDTRRQLPICSALEDIRSGLASHQVLIIQGETGSGKTTQVAQYLLQEEFGFSRIACTQPRRVAAMSVAERVAVEMEVTLGEQVGYTIRFEDRSSESTVLKYLTDGMLLREAMSDPTLSDYDVIVLDEAHERTIATDILFGLLKDLLVKRPELKVVVMSATLDTEKFTTFWDDAPLIQVSGRTFPVEIVYSEQTESDYYLATINTIKNIHLHEPAGDILVFMTGEEEIENTCRDIRREIRQYGNSVGPIDVIPLYSTLPTHQQQRIFRQAPEGQHGKPGRKCIIATNIAESSLTIDGIVYVVDTGLVKQKVYNPRLRIESLLISEVSRASAQQRSGRAGRTRPGKCYRLYTEKTFKKLEENNYPEILRTNLSAVVLYMKTLGIQDLVHFDFMDPPAPETMMRALETLIYLTAIDEEGDLTEMGKHMAEFPIDPLVAHCVLRSVEFECSSQMLTVAAMLSVQNCFVRSGGSEFRADKAKRSLSHPDGDHLTLLQVYEAFLEQGRDKAWCNEKFLNPRSLEAAIKIRAQLAGIFKRIGLPELTASPEKLSVSLRKALVTGFFMQIVRQELNHYKTVKDNQVVLLHPSHTMGKTPKWVLYNEFVLTSKSYVRTISVINPKWLLRYAQPYYESVPDLYKILSKDL